MNFYQKAFNLELNFLHESKQYAELKTGETKLAFVSNSLAESNGVVFIKNNSKNPTAAGFEIALVSENVKDSYSLSLSNGAKKVKEPVIKPWGQEVAYVHDLNGIIVEICSPMG